MHKLTNLGMWLMELSELQHKMAQVSQME